MKVKLTYRGKDDKIEKKVVTDQAVLDALIEILDKSGVGYIKEDLEAKGYVRMQ